MFCRNCARQSFWAFPRASAFTINDVDVANIYELLLSLYVCGARRAVWPMGTMCCAHEQIHNRRCSNEFIYLSLFDCWLREEAIENSRPMLKKRRSEYENIHRQ